jgi:hypothetical protein
MAEREIREIIRSLCERLDRTVMKPVCRVAAPMALGAGLAMASGCAEDTGNNAAYMAPDIVDTGSTTDPGVQPPYMAPDNGSVPVYSAPVDVALTDEAAVDPGAQPPYMAPDDGVQPLYMGPDDAVEPVDPGVQPPYMAPDNGIQPLYAADFDAGEATDAAVDPGNAAAYMAPMYSAPSPAPEDGR